MLWFYLQRQDSGRERKSERQVCEEFLDTRFVRSSTTQRSYLLGEDGQYSLSPNAVPFPAAPPDAAVRQIVDAVDAGSSMRQVFQRLGMETTFRRVNPARIKLTTSAFPYLRAVPAEGGDGGGQGPGPKTEQLREASLQKFKNARRKPAG
jgi:hypothetical protein